MASEAAFSCEQFIWGKLIDQETDLHGYTIAAKSPGLSDAMCGRVVSFAKIGTSVDLDIFTGAWGLFEVDSDLLAFGEFRRSPLPEPRRTYYSQVRYLVFSATEFEKLDSDFRHLVDLCENDLAPIGTRQKFTSLPKPTIIVRDHRDRAHIVERVANEIGADFLLDVLQAVLGKYPVAIYDFPESSFTLDFLESIVSLLPQGVRHKITFATQVPDADSTPVRIKLGMGSKRYTSRHMVVRRSPPAVVPKELLAEINNRYCTWIRRELARNGANWDDLVKRISSISINKTPSPFSSIDAELADVVAPIEPRLVLHEHDSGKKDIAEVLSYLAELRAIHDPEALEDLAIRVLSKVSRDRPYDWDRVDRLFRLYSSATDEEFFSLIEHWGKAVDAPRRVLYLLARHVEAVGKNGSSTLQRLLGATQILAVNSRFDRQCLLESLDAYFRADPSLESIKLLHALPDLTHRINLYFPKLGKTLAHLYSDSDPASPVELVDELTSASCLIWYLHIVGRAVLDRRALAYLPETYSSLEKAREKSFASGITETYAATTRLLAFLVDFLAAPEILLSSQALEVIAHLAVAVDSPDLLQLVLSRYFLQVSDESQFQAFFGGLAKSLLARQSPERACTYVAIIVKKAGLTPMASIDALMAAYEVIGWSNASDVAIEACMAQMQPQLPATHRLDFARFLSATLQDRHRNNVSATWTLTRLIVEIAVRQPSPRSLRSWLLVARRLASSPQMGVEYHNFIRVALRDLGRLRCSESVIWLLNHITPREAESLETALFELPLHRTEVLGITFSRVRRLAYMARRLLAASQLPTADMQKIAKSNNKASPPNYSYLVEHLNRQGFQIGARKHELLLIIEGLRDSEARGQEPDQRECQLRWYAKCLELDIRTIDRGRPMIALALASVAPGKEWRKRQYDNTVRARNVVSRADGKSKIGDILSDLMEALVT